MLKGPIYILTHDTTVADLVGTNKADTKVKVYPGICPEPEQHPFLVLRITQKLDHEPCKGVKSTTFLYGFDVFIYTKNYDEGDAIADAVREALDQVATATYNGIDIDECRYNNTVDDYVDQYQLHAKTVSFEAVVNES